jgi:hypothetical protein
MSTIAHESPAAASESARRPVDLVAREMWAGIAIAVMWLVVLFDALWGPDIVSISNPTNSTTIPSAVVVALCAFFGTRVVAKYGFGGREDG